MHVEAVEGEEEAGGVDEGGEEQVAADEIVVAVADAGDGAGRGDEAVVGVQAVHGGDVGKAVGFGEGAPDVGGCVLVGYLRW